MANIVYDVKLRRPACAILQAVYGGDMGIASLFPCESWLVNPTDDMKCYIVSDEQLKHLITIAKVEHPDG